MEESWSSIEDFPTGFKMGAKRRDAQKRRKRNPRSKEEELLKGESGFKRVSVFLKKE